MDAEGRIRQLDLDRLDEPAAAAAKLRRLIPDLENGEDLSFALGVYGTCLRQLGEVDEAKLILAQAQSMARSLKLVDLEADAIQRFAVVIASDGRFEDALRITSQSISLFAAVGNQDGIGRALVHQGGFQWHLENIRKADQLFCSALGFLGRDSHEYRFASHSGRAHCQIELGNNSACAAALEAARLLIPAVSKTAQTKFLWAGGRLARRAGRYDLSEAVFRSALPLFVETRQGLEAALVSVELARSLVAQGRSAEAVRICDDTKKLLFYLPDDSSASRILRGLWIQSRKQLTEEMLREAARHLERERTGPLPRKA